MLIFIRLVTFIVLAILVALIEDWTKPYPLKLGGVAAAVSAVILVIILWLSRTKPLKGVRGRESWLREVLLGTFATIAWCGSVQLYLQIAQRTPGLAESIVDSGREETEKNVSMLENAGSSKPAADLLLTALENPHTPQCTQAFAERAILNLSRAATAADGKSREDLIRKAIEVATRYKVHDDLPKAMLDRLLDRDALTGLNGKVSFAEARASKAEAEQQRLTTKQLALEKTQKASEDERGRLEAEEQHLRATQAAMEQNHKAEAAKLKHSLDSLQKALTHLAESAVLHASSLSGNVIDGDLESARRTLQRIIQDTGKSDGPAKAALGKLEAAILANQPADIPRGTTARIHQVDANIMRGMALVDIKVADAAGMPIQGLVNKDFSAIQAGRRLRIYASPILRSGTLAVEALLDISRSTDGAPISAMKLAVPEFVTRLPANALIRVATFSDRMTLLTDFTLDRSRVLAPIQRIHAEGGTALNQVVYDEIQVLAAKSGARVLGIFTDGENSLPGPRVEEIIAAARREKIAVYFVALKSPGYSDTSVIERIARETGGKVFPVQHTNQLTESFRVFADSLQETGYRLAVLDYDPKVPCEVTIGGRGAIALTVEASDANTPLARSIAR